MHCCTVKRFFPERCGFSWSGDGAGTRGVRELIQLQIEQILSTILLSQVTSPFLRRKLGIISGWILFFST